MLNLVICKVTNGLKKLDYYYYYYYYYNFMSLLDHSIKICSSALVKNFLLMTSDRKFQNPSDQQLSWRQTNLQEQRVYRNSETGEMSNITAMLV